MTVTSLILVYGKRVSFDVLVELVTGKTPKQASKEKINSWNIEEQKGLPTKMCFVRIPHETEKFYEGRNRGDEEKMHVGVMIGEISIGEVETLPDTTQYLTQYSKIVAKLEKRGFAKLAEFLKDSPVIIASPDDCSCCS